MADYYTEKLSAERLKKCYDIAAPRIKQYLEAELEFLLERINQNDEVLELGCGYGRVLLSLCRKAKSVFGVDIALDNLQYAREYLFSAPNCYIASMDTVHLGFSDHSFDCVVCIQNGISAFHVDQPELIRESIRVCKPTGRVLFSSYSDKIWEERLKWFELQAETGLVGEIDYAKTANGTIVCKDGFLATTVSPRQFAELTEGLKADVQIVEVDESSIFCEIVSQAD